MTSKAVFGFIFFFACAASFAQQDAINAIPEVVVSDLQLLHFSETQLVQKINDSVILRNPSSLTSLLQYNSAIYFKENGYGMVASPSFRGTSAQQTAVIWNGININSQFNGQTDFNTISANSFQSVAIRPGGGSVIYGSSAIGGSIHLNNELYFGEAFSNDLQFSYGSFNSAALLYRINAATKQWTISSSVSRNASDNDYPILKTGNKNKNGNLENVSYNLAAAYLLDVRNSVKLYTNVFAGDRHLSLLTPTDTKSKYTDSNSRTMIEWSQKGSSFDSRLRAALLTEQYHYFNDVNNDNSVGSKAETYVTRYDATFSIGNIGVNALVDYTTITAAGSDIRDAQRNVVSASILAKQRIGEKVSYEAGIRMESSSDYESPLLFSFGAKYKISSNSIVRINASKNFRVPTLNDLYWIQGGNPDLRPETSYQAEVGGDYIFKNGKMSFTAYYNTVDDMIQWIPIGGTLWYPQNIIKVNSFGGEALLQVRKNFGKNILLFNATYAYTISENAATAKQLIYVPIHKTTASLAYSRGAVSANFQLLYNDAVFTLSNNNPNYMVDAYFVSNLGIEYDFGKKYAAGFKILNVFDEAYEVVEHRPFPGRHYSFFVTVKL